jgi:hypothetical protein
MKNRKEVTSSFTSVRKFRELNAATGWPTLKTTIFIYFKITPEETGVFQPVEIINA